MLVTTRLLLSRKAQTQAVFVASRVSHMYVVQRWLYPWVEEGLVVHHLLSGTFLQVTRVGGPLASHSGSLVGHVITAC